MKKYKFIVLICISFMLTFFVTGCSSLGNIEERFTSSTSRNTVVSFGVEKEDIIKIEYDVIVEEGTLTIKLEDPNGNTIEEFEADSKGNEEIFIEEEGEYELHATFNDFKGKAKIKANK